MSLNIGQSLQEGLARTIASGVNARETSRVLATDAVVAFLRGES